MKVHYISDLHLDFWIKEMSESKKMINQIENFIKNINFSEADVLIIAGDLGHYFVQKSVFLKIIKRFYKNIIIVSGNHDRYLVSKKQQKKYSWSSDSRVNETKEFCKKIDGLYLLDGEELKIDGVTFAGVGMSWDDSFFNLFKKRNPNNYYPQVTTLFNNKMNDSKLIMDGYKPYPINYGYGGKELISSFDPFEFFRKEYKKLQKISSNVDVMISHYGPIVPDDIDENYNNPTTTFYYFDGEYELKRISPQKWVFGHTHKNHDFYINETNLICNPLGYPHEKTNQKIKCFEI